MKSVALDTDVVIAALDEADAHHERARRVISELLARRVRLLISTINYAEVLVRPAGQPEALKAAIDAMDALRIETVPPSARIAQRAASHRGRGVSLADGFALATAEASGGLIASFDSRVIRAAGQLGLSLAIE